MAAWSRRQRACYPVRGERAVVHVVFHRAGLRAPSTAVKRRPVEDKRHVVPAEKLGRVFRSGIAALQSKAAKVEPGGEGGGVWTL